MWMYHGTDEFAYKNIKRTRQIVPGYNTDSCTEELNKVIERSCGRNIRAGCVFMADSRDIEYSYDYVIRVSTSRLDCSKLFVARFDVLDKILCACSDNNYEASVKLGREYYKSFIDFKRFESNIDKYKNMYGMIELLYYGTIYI